MQPATRRSAITRNGVAAGSVWETRMKMDEVTGGMKVFNAVGDSHDDEEGLRVYGKIRRRSNEVGVEKRKRKIWKQPEPQNSPILPAKLPAAGSGVEVEGLMSGCDGDANDEEIEDEVMEIEVEEQKRGFDDKEMDLPAGKGKQIEEVKTIEENTEIPISVEKKTSYTVDLKEKDPDPAPYLQDDGEDEEEIKIDSIYGESNKMQHIVDLVMWRDISKTSFAFGFGTFLLLSSSYAGDLNFSLISAISYLGLLYLAVIFLMRSVLRRGEEQGMNDRDENHLIGEEDAIGFLRRILPYINELLLRTRALFSGDPETTMKMAVILFVMARCGSSLTVSTLAKIAFYGVFTVPKALSSYSVQLCRYGKFWLARFRDGWDTCTHKKAIAIAIFTLIWNLSSTVARIWAVFMLIIVIRLYQRCMIMTPEEGYEVPEEKQQQQQQQKHQHHPLSPPPPPPPQQNITNSLSLTPRPRREPGLAKMPLDVKVKRLK
ncbi:Reticulon-like protein B21 [Platanthera zijinensis]|uniref:Reticulon-like protein n=1 Tax=Platanthera zijinensis TaxID=2320716 RepID=A0AAP0FSM5_9ASPA